MATHDYVIDNSTGANVRADLNLVLQAVLTNNSNSSSPSTTAAYMLWVDTTANIVKIRNSANNAWINLFTTAGGVDVDAASNFNEDVTFTGASANVVWDKSDNALEFADNAKAIFGTGNDLEIYHDGSNSRIHSPSHSLFIRTGNVAGFFNGDGAEDILKGTVNGAVELYFDNGKKAETVTGGFTVTVVCTATSFAGDGSALTGISAGATGGGSDEVFYENSTTVTTSYSITSNKNAMSAGPLSINSGAVVTVPSGSVWTIV